MIDPARHLLRALARCATAAVISPVLRHEGMTAWSSATFAGAQHRVAVEGDDLAAWLAAMPEAELPMRGCFVAGCDVAITTHGAMLTVLVLEE